VCTLACLPAAAAADCSQWPAGQRAAKSYRPGPVCPPPHIHIIGAVHHQSGGKFKDEWDTHSKGARLMVMISSQVNECKARLSPKRLLLGSAS
jgi:hypothetical protein